jgi:alpha-1,2-mannosyltransferase
MQRWAAPLALGLAAIGLLVLGAVLAAWYNESRGWAYDFHPYYDGALRLLATGSPYQSVTLNGPFQPGPKGLYLYSPVLAVLFVPMTWLGENAAILVWAALHIAALVGICALMPIPRHLRLAMFGIACLTAPVLYDIDLGNVSLFVTLAAVLVWRWLDKPLSGVALAAALLVRPGMAVIAGWWLLRGRWKPVAWTIGTFAVVGLVSLIFLRPEVWLQWLTVLRNVSNVTGVKANVDLGSAVLMLGGSTTLAQIALYSGYAIAAGAILLSLRRDRELSYVVALMGSLLLQPLLWDHYLCNLLVVAAFLAARGRLWGLALPLLCWSPQVIALLIPEMRAHADGALALIAVLGTLLPFLAPDRGERAGFLWERLGRWGRGRGERDVIADAQA